MSTGFDRPSAGGATARGGIPVARELAAWTRPLLPSAADWRIGSTWRLDLVSGVTVGIVALPLALAFGISSGVGPEAGLVTAIVAGLVAAVFGGSNVQVSGPTGAMAVVLAPIVAEHGAGIVPLVTVLAGLVVLAAGAAKLGRLVAIIPWPVIEGFTAGIGVIIFLQQVPGAFGKHGNATNDAVAAWLSISHLSWPQAGWALGAIAIVAAIMVGSLLLNPRIPGSIIAVILVTVLAIAAGSPLATIGKLPSSLPSPAWPRVGWGDLGQLGGSVLAIAALAAIESLLSARVAASMADTGRYDADRELVGQGLASVVAGLFGGMPATGAIARTAVNVRTGGRSRLAAVSHALVLLLIVLVGTPLVARIPLAALAGVLMVTAVRMISPSVVKSVVTSTPGAAVTFAITLIVTVSFDLIVAVGIGLGVAALVTLITLARGAGVHREVLPGPPEPGDERIALFRIDGALFFGAAERILDRVLETHGTEVVILRLSQLQSLDATGARTLAELVTALERREITVLLKGLRPEHLRLARAVGVLDALRDEKHSFAELPAAVAHARSHVERNAITRAFVEG